MLLFASPPCPPIIEVIMIEAIRNATASPVSRRICLPERQRSPRTLNSDPRQSQIPLKNIEDVRGQLVSPFVLVGVGPVAIQASGFCEIFRECLPISAF